MDKVVIKRSILFVGYVCAWVRACVRVYTGKVVEVFTFVKTYAIALMKVDAHRQCFGMVQIGALGTMQKQTL